MSYLLGLVLAVCGLGFSSNMDNLVRLIRVQQMHNQLEYSRSSKWFI